MGAMDEALNPTGFISRRSDKPKPPCRFCDLGFEVKRHKEWPPVNHPPFDGHGESSDE